KAGFRLELLDAIAVALAEDPPVKQTDFVARIISAMFREFSAAALVFGAVPSRQEAIDNVPGEQLQIFSLRQVGRIDGVKNRVHAPRQLRARRRAFLPARSIRP